MQSVSLLVIIAFVSFFVNALFLILFTFYPNSRYQKNHFLFAFSSNLLSKQLMFFRKITFLFLYFKSPLKNSALFILTYAIGCVYYKRINEII